MSRLNHILIMSKLQEVFDRIQKTKKEQKVIKSAYRDALANSGRHQEVAEKIKALREEKNKIVQSVKEEFSSELDKLETIKTEIETDMMIMSDLAINELTKGNLIEISDEYSNKYEPLFSVKFKKIG